MDNKQDAINKILAGNMTTDGWNSLTGDGALESQEATHEQLVAAWQRKRDIAVPFIEHPLALQLLREQTIDEPAFKPDEFGAFDAIVYGLFREGQDSMIRFIEACVKQAKEGPPDPPVEPQQETTPL